MHLYHLYHVLHAVREFAKSDTGKKLGKVIRKTFGDTQDKTIKSEERDGKK